MVDTPTLIMSKTAFAARRGVGVSTVSKWIERKRISGDALTADGRINVTIAEQQLGIRLDVVRSEGARAASQIAGGDEANEPAASVREKILEVELEQKRRRLEVERGVYVRADQVRAERGRALKQMIAAIDNWVGELPAELGLDQTQSAQIRSAWRRFRERQADAALAQAQSLPELMTDAA